MLTEKPYFTLYIDAHLCVGYILLNGQFMYGAEMNPVSFDQPINHWIRKGKNELMLLLMPMDEEGEMGNFPQGARCEMTLSVRQSGTPAEENIAISSLKFEASDPEHIGGNTPAGNLGSKNGFAPDKKGDVKIGKVKKELFQGMGMIATRNITLPKLGLPAWKFYGSDDITPLSGVDIEGQLDKESHKALKEELLPIYKKIWSALDSGNVDEILPLYEERSSETDAAFFKEPGATGKRLAEVLKESVADPEQKLWPITDDNAMCKISDNNKLARLVQNSQNPLLSFDEPALGLAHHYDAVFRKSGKKWILTR